MKGTVGEIAAKIGGVVRGDSETVIDGAATIDRARSGSITFVTGKKAWERFCSSEASAAIVSGVEGIVTDRPLIEVEDAETAFASVVAMFRIPFARTEHRGIDPRAAVAGSARIGNDVRIGQGAFIGESVRIGNRCTIHSGVRILDGCEIGDDSVLFPNSVLYERTTVGQRVIVHSGTVIGAYGFGYKTRNGKHILSAQLGAVAISDDVEIGANTTIDRGTFDDTLIGEGTKIDNQVMIAHNCRIGRHNLICSQSGIAGSSSTGDYVVMAGQVGVGDHLNIGNHVTLCAKAGVMRDVADGETMVGAPAMPVREQMQVWAHTLKLPELKRKIRQLEQDLKRLQDMRQDSTLRLRAG